MPTYFMETAAFDVGDILHVLVRNDSEAKRVSCRHRLQRQGVV